VVEDFPGVQYQVENRMVPVGFEQCRLPADLHGVALGKRCRQPCGGFGLQNPYSWMWLTSHQREIQMCLDGDVSVHDFDFKLKQRRQAISDESLMDTRLKPMTSVKEYPALESFVSAPVFRCEELGSQCRPWAVQHLGNIR